MSIEALNWAFNLSLDSPSDKAVLIALSNHATPDGRCWPSIRRVSLYTSLTDRAVRLALRRLEDAGLIRTTEREGTSNLYDLALPEVGRNVVQGGRNEVQGGEERGSSKPKRTIKNPTQETREALPPEWWPPADQIAWAASAFPVIAKEIEHETHKFVAHSEETGRTHARPIAAWRRWISNAAIYAARSNTRTGPGRKLDAAGLSQRNAATVDRVLGQVLGGEDVVGHDGDASARTARRA
jgi:DNA-binding transcriptional ArsR family regulator